jgi:hypothetical protein
MIVHMKRQSEKRISNINNNRKAEEARNRMT